MLSIQPLCGCHPFDQAHCACVMYLFQRVGGQHVGWPHQKDELDERGGIKGRTREAERRGEVWRLSLACPSASQSCGEMR